MNSSEENRSSNTSSAPGRELLQELMPKLGMSTADDTGRYKNQARRKYVLPKLLLLLLLVSLIAAAACVLLLPVRFHDVQTTEAPDAAEVSFQVDRLPLLESVTATLDGRPIAVTLLDAGVYRLELERNGELVITARTFTDRYTTLNVTIDCIDIEPPHVARDELSGGHLYIYLTDGTEHSSGINWQTLQATYAATGALFEVTEVDEEAGCICFPLPEQSVRFYIEDNNGNPLSLRLDRTGLDG